MSNVTDSAPQHGVQVGNRPVRVWGNCSGMHPPSNARHAKLFSSREAHLARKQLSCLLGNPREAVSTRGGSATRCAPWLLEQAVGLATDIAARLGRLFLGEALCAGLRVSRALEPTERIPRKRTLQISGSRRFRELQRQPLSSQWYEAHGQSGAITDPKPREESHSQVPYVNDLA